MVAILPNPCQVLPVRPIPSRKPRAVAWWICRPAVQAITRHSETRRRAFASPSLRSCIKDDPAGHRACNQPRRRGDNIASVRPARCNASGNARWRTNAALAWLEKDGPRTLWIGVWSENLGAQRFYARHGFGRVGSYEFPVGRVRDLEYILRRPAAAL